ncbi:helix-turn-helix domain-containing protein [Morganella morganii]|uniref:helix-turn-helix domain-containing protein n=1 Tax=Morganella morganii TaxID=582 RepID=UPI003EBAB772
MKKSAAFAILIKKLRLEHGLSGEQLAKLINVSQQQISRYEREVTELKLAHLEKIAAAFRIDFWQFMHEAQKIDKSDNLNPNI